MSEDFRDIELDETEKINVVPLADVSLVLLIVLMILSPVAMQSVIKVLAPSIQGQSQSQKTPESKEPLLIEIHPTGLLLNNTPVGSDYELMIQLSLKLGAEQERPVLVNADPEILVGRVVEILDLAKHSGARKVSLLKKTGTA